ncbi:MAG: glycine zipper family protein [Betaproteobacteria bacterium]|nr:glycine zipper family protein [Betaproteobacteria bacterium]MBK6600048.1 glycine zipper family protein [Betaproteobacteria bacterium]MBK7080528.1 glycine zipper family protein [Betaproteobacteria bacterium]MBK8688879.1 glycine zipper family protein [Betaproteobacteria bacterium]MBK9674588.1 glycine zipper family protein [Betaproteobacteria bacterium]
MRRGWIWPAAALTVALSGCVTVPLGPAIGALPGPAKTAAEFGADDAHCRNHAQAAIGGVAQAATDQAAATAVAGTMMGAITGAIIGAATGDAGAGAAIGAGTGLLWGGAAGAPGYVSYDLQRRYDAYYAQCMYALGNQVPGRVTYRTPRYPPPNTPPPPGLAGSPVAPRAVPGAAAPGVPPADAALPGNYPPPNTPPPPGVDSGTRGRVVPAPVNPPPRTPPAAIPPLGTPPPPS